MESTSAENEKKRGQYARVLRCLRREGPLGRLQLGRRLGVSKSRICALAQEMVDAGLLVEDLDRPERRGRRPVPLRLNPARGCFLGFDFEAQRMRLAAVDFAGQVRWREQRKFKPPADRARLIERLLAAIERGLDRIRQEAPPPLGIGIAAPGIIDQAAGVLVRSDFIPAASNLPLRDLAASRTGLPCSMDHNIRAYALTEWTSGAAQRLSSFICLAVRSGVAAAVVQDGRLLAGAHGLAGEVGHAPVPSEKPASQWKAFQDVVSEHALGVDAEAKGFALSPARARRAGELVGAQAAALAAVFDPEAVVLAGALVQPDGPLWPALERAFHRFMLPDLADRVRLLPSRVGPFAAAIGAAHQCFQRLYPVE